MFHAQIANAGRNDAQRQNFRHRRAGPADLLGDFVVGVIEMIGQALQAVRFFKRGEVFALNIFDQPEFQGFRVVGDLFDARHFVQTSGAGGVVAAFAGYDVVRIFAGIEAHQQRL